MFRGVAIAPMVVAIVALAVSAQLQWTSRTPNPSPPIRSYHAMAYDSARQRVVLFGVSTTFPTGNQTWEWDGTAWTWGSPKTYPSGGGYAMAYDAVRRRVVLFGGGVYGPSETWLWDGVSWTQSTPATSPPPRTGHAMAYDAVRRRVVLFGGSPTGSALNDTWEWDGTTWIRQWPAASPPARTEHAMAYDAARGRVILFGGRSATYFDDTWIWQGSTWIRARPSVHPPWRRAHSMTYDATIQRVILFGGMYDVAVTQFFNDTWAWDGNTWAQHTPATSPPARAYHTIACHEAAQRIVAYGGIGGPWPPTNVPNDTWEYGATRLVGSGTPRPGRVLSFTLTAAPDAGRPYQVGSSLGTGPLSLGGLTLGLSADPLLAVSVAGALPGVFQQYGGVLDASGRASAAMRIPPAPALVGADIHTAFVTIGWPSSRGIRSVSNTESFTIIP
jgi:hypothetical protein